MFLWTFVSLQIVSPSGTFPNLTHQKAAKKLMKVFWPKKGPPRHPDPEPNVNVHVWEQVAS